ncbi:MAG: AAA family ATPase [Candidatus Magnetoovum sp. WYHC-5]|nr:AAA family ATPase [Candidatus Magnetoovum sp. WYHC-5]
MSQEIIAIYGPKGGVGKSSISSNLSIALARLNKQVIAVDLDLGGANLHVLLGIKNYEYSLDDFILKNISSLSDALISTQVNNLKVICGGSQLPDVANLQYVQKVKIINHITKLRSDIIILDLAAGLSFNVVDFLFMATKGLIVTTPEVTSLMNVYSIIKTSVFRWLSLFFKSKQNQRLIDLLNEARDFKKNPHLSTMEGFFKEAYKIDAGIAETAKGRVLKLRPLIIINRVQTESDAKVGGVLQALTSQYLGISVDVILTIPEDNMVRHAIKSMTPVLIGYPMCSFSQSIKKLALKLVSNPV